MRKIAELDDNGAILDTYQLSELAHACIEGWMATQTVDDSPVYPSVFRAIVHRVETEFVPFCVAANPPAVITKLTAARDALIAEFNAKIEEIEASI